ncbi:MAG TPA: Uma2 family endonuclease [Rhodothermales bacterium]|nr:Uma2 family endonuclease [Rhodothermales bacterium]
MATYSGKSASDMISSIPGKPGSILRLGRRRWTYDDLREMPESMERMEIIDGELYMSPSAHVMRHQNAVGNLFFAFRSWVEAHDLGKVFVAPADVVLSQDRVVQPDVFFVSKERLHTVGAFVSEVPDLVIEVVSPSSAVYDRKTKFALYEESGVPEYWLVDPEDQSIDVYALRENGYEQIGYFTGDEQARSELLDGFTVEVDTVFS